MKCYKQRGKGRGNRDVIVEDEDQIKDGQLKEKKRTIESEEIYEEDQSLKIVEKEKEDRDNFHYDINVFDCKEDFNSGQYNKSMIYETTKKKYLVESDVASIEASNLNLETCDRHDWSIQREDIGKEIEIFTNVSQEKLVETFKDEASNRRSKSVHQVQVFDNLPKIEVKTIKVLDP
ncbi:hypothetical protein KY285_018130 [Solanum tuberosum]|nr:hypothetical protein KY284_018124 [Solanum tuberosum]KAH0703852.1 hypothetical protein KY285_018130 [Solanum tuberosum]